MSEKDLYYYETLHLASAGFRVRLFSRQGGINNLKLEQNMGRKHFHLAPLSPQESDALKSFMREMLVKGQLRRRWRGNAVFDSARGSTVQEISQDLDVSERSVRTWLHNFQRRGVAGLYDDRAPRGRLNRAQVNQVFQLKYTITKSKSTGKLTFRKTEMTYRQIAQWIKSKWDISLSHIRVWRIIRKRLRDGDFTDIVPL